MILDQPVPLADKTLASTYLPGVDIVVSGAQVGTAPLVYRFTAVAGETTKQAIYTFGNADGTGPLAATLQAKVDDWRQDIADKAGWDEHARLAAVTIV